MFMNMFIVYTLQRYRTTINVLLRLHSDAELKAQQTFTLWNQRPQPNVYGFEKILCEKHDNFSLANHKTAQNEKNRIKR